MVPKLPLWAEELEETLKIPNRLFHEKEAPSGCNLLEFTHLSGPPTSSPDATSTSLHSVNDVCNRTVLTDFFGWGFCFSGPSSLSLSLSLLRLFVIPSLPIPGVSIVGSTLQGFKGSRCGLFAWVW